MWTVYKYSMVKILGIFIVTICAMNSSFAQKGPDLKSLTYSAKKLEGTEFKIQFTPPKDHHFNMDAPSEVKQIAGKDTEKATLEKKPVEILAKFSAMKAGCEIKTELYLCDDKNTYCVPIKKNFTCEDLKKKTPVTGKTSTEQTAPPIGALEDNLKIFLMNDSKGAFEKALSEKKLVLIDFFGIWCPPCNMLDETVFSTKEFSNMQKEYVFLKMDADATTSFDLKSKYNVKGYPTVILANSQGEEISRIVGSRKPKAFLGEMKNALRLKTMSLTERIAKAESLKSPDSAFDLAKMFLDQEDFGNSLKYSMIGLKKGTATLEQRQVLISTQIALMKESAKEEIAQRKLATFIESTLQSDPTGIEAFDRADELVKLGEDLKDDGLKNRGMNAKFKNAEFLLKNPKVYENSEISEADLYSTMADVYENLKEDAKMKEAYMKAALSYEKDIKASGLPIESERGHNLERIYCIYKAGLVDEALKLYEQLEAHYPQEFTFYYSHSSVLKELGKKEQALEKAEKALEFSYGDNQLRAVNVVAELKSQLGKKKEALKLIEETLQKFPEVKDMRVRSGRYIEKLNKLKDQIKKM